MRIILRYVFTASRMWDGGPLNSPEQGRKFGRYWDVAWYEKPLGGKVGPEIRGIDRAPIRL